MMDGHEAADLAGNAPVSIATAVPAIVVSAIRFSDANTLQAEE